MREEEVVDVVGTVLVVVGMLGIACSLLSGFFVELPGIITFSRSINLTGFCSCSSSSNISSMITSPVVLPLVFEEFVAVVGGSFVGVGPEGGLIESSFTCAGDERTEDVARKHTENNRSSFLPQELTCYFGSHDLN